MGAEIIRLEGSKSLHDALEFVSERLTQELPNVFLGGLIVVSADDESALGGSGTGIICNPRYSHEQRLALIDAILRAVCGWREAEVNSEAR